MDIVKILNDRNIAITGHEGFLGGYLSKELKQNKINYLAIEGDIRDTGTWKEGFDILYHLAAATSQKFSKSPQEAFASNVHGVFQALEACRINNAHIIFISTSGVYEANEEGFFSEDHPVSPSSLYAQSKLMGEELCRFYNKKYGVKCLIFRLFNVYGIGQKSDFLIPYLVEKAMKGQRAIINHLHSSRDFVYVDDVVSLLLKSVSYDKDFGVFNIGTGTSYPILKVVDFINKANEKSLKYDAPEGKSDLFAISKANIDHVKEVFSWSAKVDLSDGIENIVDHYRSII